MNKTILEIRDVKQCNDGSYGYFIKGKKKARISISLKRNESLAEYGSTLLHELLHAYLELLKQKGFKFTSKAEHKFIYAVEKVVLKQMKRHLKRGK